jgi:hypothetical protein
MRSEIEVAGKIKDLRKRRLKERKQKYLSRCHLNCIHNYRHRVKGHSMVGFCHNREVIEKSCRAIVTCDDEDTAEQCKHFVCKNTNESVENDFSQVLSSPSKCGQEYPKLAILIWFLQGGVENRRPRLFTLALNKLRSIITFDW